MSFTGQLGTSQSELANIELGSPGSAPQTQQTIQAKANIFNRTPQSLQARARIQTTTDQSIQAKARFFLYVSVVTDSFNRANSATLGTADSGQTWQYSGGILQYAVDTNQAKATNASGAGGAWIDSQRAGTAAAPIQVSVDTFNVGTGNATGILFRSDGTISGTNQWFYYLSKIGGVYNLTLARESSGVFGTLYQQPPVGVAVNDSETHTLGIADDGAHIALLIDGIYQATITASDFNTQTIQGIFIDVSGSADRVDNYNVKAVATLQQIQARAHILNFVTTDQSIQALARLTNQVTHQIQAKAALTPQTIRQIQAKANLLSVARQTIQALARIAPSISAKASIVVPVTSDLEIDFLVEVAAVADLLITFDATILTRAIQSIMAKAHIMLPVATDLTITFDAGCPMPALPILRPTERVRFRGIAQVSAKASIR